MIHAAADLIKPMLTHPYGSISSMENIWVLASSNAGKLREFQHGLSPILAARGISLVNQSDLGVDPADEPFDSFEANAIAKARHAARATGLPALADDSGLCVAALGGAPGVRSARFFADAMNNAAASILTDLTDLTDLTHLTSDMANLHWLLHEMKGAADRSAFFCTVVAWVRAADDPAPIIAKGLWHGQIANAPVGSHGFGYDPIFIDLASGRSAAELSLEEKQAVSHRGQAIADFVSKFNPL
jgi:XTP/dITP diphosphohydrolase